MRRTLFTIVCLLMAMPLRADQGPAPDLAEVPPPITDPTQVRATYQTVLQRPEFQDTEEIDLNLRFKDWLTQWFMHVGEKFGDFRYAQEMPVFAKLFMSLLVLLTVSGLLYVIVRLSRRRNDLKLEAVETVPGQKIFRHPEFYDREIRQAISEANWQVAWLATWRQFLSRLENRRLVEPDRTRTNREYLNQLRGQTISVPVLALLTSVVDAYDRFIYGRQVIGESEWSRFHEQINEATLLLHLDDRTSLGRAEPGAS